MVPGSEEYIECLDDKLVIKKPDLQFCNSLPEGYKNFNFLDKEELEFFLYLKNRNISKIDILLYKIGYCNTGKYSNRIIIPSFDQNGEVNFWSARSIIKNIEYQKRYVLPAASKNIISNDYLKNWDAPIYLVEGAFDEIAIGSQAIALYGKTVNKILLKKIIEKSPPEVFICLDADAEKEADFLFEKLLSYDINVKLLNIKNDDPAKLGRQKILNTPVHEGSFLHRKIERMLFA